MVLEYLGMQFLGSSDFKDNTSFYLPLSTCIACDGLFLRLFGGFVPPIDGEIY